MTLPMAGCCAGGGVPSVIMFLPLSLFFYVTFLSQPVEKVFTQASVLSLCVGIDSVCRWEEVSQVLSMLTLTPLSSQMEILEWKNTIAKIKTH